MVKFLGPSRKDLMAETIGQSLGKGLSDFGEMYFANKSLDKVLNDKELRSKPYSERASKLEEALRPFGQTGANLLQRRLGIEQQQQSEREQQVLAKVYKGENVSSQELGNLTPEVQHKAAQIKRSKEAGKNISSSLIHAGMPEDTANKYGEMYENATEGGRTDIWKMINDELRRINDDSGAQSQETQVGDYSFAPLPQEKGRTPGEIVKLKDSREKYNLPLYQETKGFLKGLEDEHRDIQRLQQIQKRNNLPVGTEKWNIDWETGEPRSVALLHPDAQLYIKTIAGLLGKAKDFFPGRVTNFDLETFKKRFPTLANSPQGRELITKQLELANRIAYLREDSLKSAYEHYGSSADPIKIQKAAQENYEKLKPQLEERLKNLDGMLDQEYENNLEDQEMQPSQQAPKGRQNVYDPSGKIVGTVSEGDIEGLEQGYYIR